MQAHGPLRHWLLGADIGDSAWGGAGHPRGCSVVAVSFSSVAHCSHPPHAAYNPFRAVGSANASPKASASGGEDRLGRLGRRTRASRTGARPARPAPTSGESATGGGLWRANWRWSGGRQKKLLRAIVDDESSRDTRACRHATVRAAARSRTCRYRHRAACLVSDLPTVGRTAARRYCTSVRLIPTSGRAGDRGVVPRYDFGLGLPTALGGNTCSGSSASTTGALWPSWFKAFCSAGTVARSSLRWPDTQRSGAIRSLLPPRAPPLAALGDSGLTSFLTTGKELGSRCGATTSIGCRVKGCLRLLNGTAC